MYTMKDRTESQRHVSDVLVYLALLCFGVNYILYNALGIEQYKTVLRVLGVFFVLAKWVMSRKTKVTIMQAVLLVASLVAFLINGVESMNLIVLVIIGIVIGTDDKAATKIYIVNVILLLLVALLFLVGFMNNNVWYGGTEVVRKTRWTLGFRNPNHATAFFTSFFCLYLLTRMKLSKWHIIVALSLEVIVYYLTDSRTWFISFLVFSLVLFIMLYTDRFRNAIQNICIIGVDFLFIIHLFLQFIIKYLMNFDTLLSFRISRFQSELSGFGLKEFLFGGGRVSVDSVYINLLYGYGFFVYIIVWIAVHTAMKNLKEGSNYKTIAFITAMFIAGTMESSTIRPEFMSSIIVWNILMNNCQHYKRTVLESNNDLDDVKAHNTM